MPATTAPRPKPKPKGRPPGTKTPRTPRTAAQPAGNPKAASSTNDRPGLTVCRHRGDGYDMASAWEPFEGHAVQCHTVDGQATKYGLVGTRPNTDRQAEADRAHAAIVDAHPDAANGTRTVGCVRITPG